jgi:hypothetical protein
MDAEELVRSPIEHEDQRKEQKDKTHSDDGEEYPKEESSEIRSDMLRFYLGFSLGEQEWRSQA